MCMRAQLMQVWWVQHGICQYFIWRDTCIHVGHIKCKHILVPGIHVPCICVRQEQTVLYIHIHIHIYVRVCVFVCACVCSIFMCGACMLGLWIYNVSKCGVSLSMTCRWSTHTWKPEAPMWISRWSCWEAWQFRFFVFAQFVVVFQCTHINMCT